MTADLLDQLLGHEFGAILRDMIEARENMGASRKVKPGGWLISPPVHRAMHKAAHETGLVRDPRVVANELLGLPFLIIDTWAHGWQLMPDNWWKSHIKQQS